MTRLLQTTIAGSLPKPAWLAEPEALWAPWQLEGEALAEGKRDAVRLALRDQEHAGIDIVTDGEQTRRHFVTTFIEGLDGVDFEHKQDGAHPQPLRRRRAGGRRRRSRAGTRSTSTTPRFLRGETDRKVKYTLPGPMTMVDTLYDAHYRSREKLAWAFAEILNEEARAHRGRRRRRDPVRRAGVQRLLRRGARLGRARRSSAPRRASPARPPCTSATATASRPTSTGRRRWAREWRQYEQTFPAAGALGDRPGVARMRELARADRADRAPGRQGRAGRRDRRRDRPGRDARRTSRRRSARRCATCRPSGSTRAPTAAWCRWRATSPAASSRALGAGRGAGPAPSSAERPLAGPDVAHCRGPHLAAGLPATPLGSGWRYRVPGNARILPKCFVSSSSKARSVRPPRSRSTVLSFP